ncbi:MAG: hypothetical protein ACYSU2_12185, partial [Planctomycetota bacterium]
MRETTRTPEKLTSHDRSAEILERALELDGEARNAFVEGACGGDPELHEEVRALLTAHNEAGDFLNAPTSAAAAADVTLTGPVTEGPGTAIGRYK